MTDVQHEANWAEALEYIEGLLLDWLREDPRNRRFGNEAS